MEKLYICPKCLTKTLMHSDDNTLYGVDTIYTCNGCKCDFEGRENSDEGLEFIQLTNQTSLDESILEEKTETYKTYKITQNKDDNMFHVITPDGIDDAEFEDIEAAHLWVDSKASTSAIDAIKQLFPKARKLSHSAIDNMLDFDHQNKADLDSLFLVKFPTKKARLQGEIAAKKDGFILIDRTDDDEGKTPYWSFFSIDGSDKWLNESIENDSQYVYKYEAIADESISGEEFDNLEDAIEYAKNNGYETVVKYSFEKTSPNGISDYPVEAEIVYTITSTSESLENMQGNPIDKIGFGKFRLELESQNDEFAIVGYCSMKTISKKKYNSLTSASIAFKRLKKNILKVLKDCDYSVEKIEESYSKVEKIIKSIGTKIEEAFDKHDGSGPYWYFTLHGIQPGTIPKDINILDIKDTPNGSYFLSDKVLTTKELNDFEIKEKTPVLDENYCGIPEVQIISHGEWNDPELSFDDNGTTYTANYFAIEDSLYADYLDDKDFVDEHTGSYAEELASKYTFDGSDEDFQKYILDHKDEVISDIKIAGKTNNMDESWADDKLDYLSDKDKSDWDEDDWEAYNKIIRLIKKGDKGQKIKMPSIDGLAGLYTLTNGVPVNDSVSMNESSIDNKIKKKIMNINGIIADYAQSGEFYNSNSGRQRFFSIPISRYADSRDYSSYKKQIINILPDTEVYNNSYEDEIIVDVSHYYSKVNEK